MAETKAEKGMMGTTTHGGIEVVKNKQEWLESRKDLQGRKKRGAKEGRASGEPAAFGFPMGGIEEQIERLLGDVRPPRANRGEKRARGLQRNPAPIPPCYSP